MKISWKGFNQKIFSTDKGVYLLKSVVTVFLDKLPAVELPDRLYKPEAIYVKTLRDRYIKHIEETNKNIEKFYEENMNGAGFNNDKFVRRMIKVFNVLIVFVESDNYYGDMYMDYQIMTCDMHDDVRKQQIANGKPENYWKQFIKERSERNKKLTGVLESRSRDGVGHLIPEVHANVTK